jgi:hypothetical protein
MPQHPPPSLYTFIVLALEVGIWVGIGKRMFGKECGENRNFKTAARGSSSMKK